MIKALFFDLDGTLLSSKKQILPSSMKALSKCKEKGIKIFISTARAPMLDKMLGFDIGTLSLFDGGIYCNGAVIKTLQKNDYNLISSSVVKAAVDSVNQYSDVHIALHLENDFHSFNHHLPDEMLKPWGLERDEIMPLNEKSFLSTVKMIIYYKHLIDSTEPLPHQLYQDLVKSISDNANIYLQDKGRTIQIAAKNISKLSSIKELSKEYGYTDDEIAVFGDDTNDMEMLSYFTNSVAMGNASDEVKQIANYITLSNDENGIEFALKQILKII